MCLFAFQLLLCHKCTFSGLEYELPSAMLHTLPFIYSLLFKLIIWLFNHRTQYRLDLTLPTRGNEISFVYFLMICAKEPFKWNLIKINGFYVVLRLLKRNSKYR